MPWHLYLMAFLYGFAGVMHLLKPKVFMRVIPRYLPAHRALVLWSGVAEIAVAIGLCFYSTKDWAIYALILMLTLFFSIHFYMLSSKKAAAGIPKWILLLRIPLQFVLIYWAYSYL